MATSSITFTLTLVRHGQTDYNAAQILQGQIDTDLDDTGRTQINELGVRLAYTKYSLVYSSDLKRATESARIILDRSYLSPVPIMADYRLRERHLGSLQGLHRAILRVQAAKAGQSTSDFTPAGGESPAHVRERLLDFFQTRLFADVLAQQKKGVLMPKVLVVTHGGIIRPVIRYLRAFANLSHFPPLPPYSPPNASICEFAITANHYRKPQITNVKCLSLYEDSHLNFRREETIAI